jgi:alpha-L-rhamnosidase
MLRAFDLRCEYAVDPLGIGTANPRLSWALDHPERGQRQTAYQVVAAHAPEQLAEGVAHLLWDSGKVASAQSVAVPYAGPPVGSRERVYWRVRCWDAQGRPGPWSEPALFETALLESEDWHANWVGYPAAWPGRALYFRRQFEIDQPAIWARLYVCGLGYHELYVNGTRLGDSVLDPAYTDISRRIMYRTFDIGPLLTTGQNVFAAAVGNGWHGFPRLLAQIELRLADGTLAQYATGPNESWLWLVSSGPIVEHSIYQGEVYDAREEKPGWNLPMDGQPHGWTMAMHVPAPGGVLVPQSLEPIRVTDEVAPQAITRPQPGIHVIDFGQNFAGWVQLRMWGERGLQVVLRYAESIHDDGLVNQENLREAAATDVYILKGEGEEVWEPRFTYHGFRYVQVEGYPGALAPEAISGKVVHSAVPSVGSFTCSNELLNRIHRMVRWTERSNLHGIPTDCPQRNERMGWTNDMTARAEEALLNFGLARLMAKWIGDVYDAQDRKTGAITNTAPLAWGPVPADPVCVCYLETAWLLCAHYGDRRTLETYYDGFQRWLECLSGLAEEHIVSYSLWGDWAPPEQETVLGTPRHRNAPGDLVSTAFYYYTARLLARIASILGQTTDQQRYESLAAEIAKAFNTRFWNEQLGGYGTNSQSCNSLALWMGLVPEERRPRVLESLVHDVVDLHDGHLTTGNICTKYLLEALSAHGRADIALGLATQVTYPSWGYMIENGATTLWERWELSTGPGMNSHNHPMMGSVGSWFYKVLAGINVTAHTVGFDRFDIRPVLVAGLDHVTAEHKTARGIIRSAWWREGRSVRLAVGIPVNAEAEVTIPADLDHSIWEGNTCIWCGKGAAQAVAGISLLRTDASGVTFGVGSGRYEFAIRPA